MITNNIKLVIWDMDETFWNGTISEGEVVVPQRHIDIIKELTDRGIMNSISSKNDFDVVQEKLSECGIWELFVFPAVNWESKGAQIADIIKKCKLRPANCLFIDDNPYNLNEAVHHCPGLQVGGMELIDTLPDNQYLAGSEDRKHTRLKQFKLLEEKNKVRDQFDSNEAFLYMSDICVEIKHDCKAHAERILDLINRSNQLNYTKIRLKEQELNDLLEDASYCTGYVSVHDKFGDYGIVGFFAVKDGFAEHFLFSCRTIGIGVEQWVYAQLGYPRLEISGEVITQLSHDEKPGWINRKQDAALEMAAEAAKGFGNRRKILIRGGCDLKQLEPYLKGQNLCTEFNFLNYHRDHTVFAVDIATAPQALLDEFVEKVPFLYEDSFKTDMYSEGNDIVVYSLLMDYVQAVYEYQDNPDIRLAWGGFSDPLTSGHLCGFETESVQWFLDHFTLKGEGIPELFWNNLEAIRAKIPRNTALILINGCEIPHENKEEPNYVEQHRILNSVVDRFVEKHDNVYLLDMRKIVKSRSDLEDNIRHYKRSIYYEMAKNLVSIMNEIGNEDVTVSKINRRVLWQNFKKTARAVWRSFMK